MNEGRGKRFARAAGRVAVGSVAAAIAIVTLPGKYVPVAQAAYTVDQTYAQVVVAVQRINAVAVLVDGLKGNTSGSIAFDVWNGFKLSGTAYAQVLADTWRDSESAKNGIASARTELASARSVLNTRIGQVQGNIWSDTKVNKTGGAIAALQVLANAETYATSGASAASTAASVASANATALGKVQTALNTAATVQADATARLASIVQALARVEAQSGTPLTAADVTAIRTGLTNIANGIVKAAVPDNCREDKQKTRSDWWVSLTSGAPGTGPFDECAGTEQALKRHAEFMRKAALERLKERARERLLERVKDAQERKDAAEEVEKGRKEQVDRLLGGLRDLGEGLGEDLKELGRKVEDVKRAVEQNGGGGTGPGTTPGPGDMPGTEPGLGEWSDVAVCVVPKVQGSVCDAPSIDFPVIGKWYVFGRCDQLPDWLPTWRALLGALILVSTCLLCFKWIIGAIGVSAPTTDGG